MHVIMNTYIIRRSGLITMLTWVLMLLFGIIEDMEEALKAQ